MKKQLNKWQFGIKIKPDVMRYKSGWRTFDFYILKLKSFPQEGCELRKHNYKGFRIIFYFWFPIEKY